MLGADLSRTEVPASVFARSMTATNVIGVQLRAPIEVLLLKKEERNFTSERGSKNRCVELMISFRSCRDAVLAQLLFPQIA